MHLQLNHQFETECYNYKMFYINHMITMKQISTVDIYKIKRKESKYMTTENHQMAKEERKKREKKERRKKKRKKEIV